MSRDGEGLLLLDGRTGLGRDELGGKAAGIEWMRSLDIPVPPAFVLTTTVCRRYYDEGRRVPGDVWDRVPAGMVEIEKDTGRTFGCGPHPLLVSVRSGAATSMPGMMDTVLNLGVTPGVEQALAASGGSAFAADIRRRFHEQFSKVVGLDTPDDPWEQLRLAIAAVFDSWHSRRAQAYRRDRGIPDEGGTAVTVQAMVFGTLDDRSGTGVLFTRDPLSGADEPYGEWLVGGQGEDVVSGRADARPLADLGDLLPAAHETLLTAGGRLERAARDVQDIEFTIESGRLWLLQTRAAKRSPLAAVRHAVALCREGHLEPHEALDRITPGQVEALLRPYIDPTAASSATVLATGKAACPGIGTGTVALDAAGAEELIEQGVEAVLARPTTDPEDVPAMSSAAAVITEHGGSTSHAAVTCREIAVPCIVGCGPDTVTRLRGHTVTIDGAAGHVYQGALAVRQAVDSDDLASLTDWARAEADAPTDTDLPGLLRARGRTLPSR